MKSDDTPDIIVWTGLFLLLLQENKYKNLIELDHETTNTKAEE